MAIIPCPCSVSRHSYILYTKYIRALFRVFGSSAATQVLRPLFLSKTLRTGKENCYWQRWRKMGMNSKSGISIQLLSRSVCSAFFLSLGGTKTAQSRTFSQAEFNRVAAAFPLVVSMVVKSRRILLTQYYKEREAFQAIFYIPKCIFPESYVVMCVYRNNGIGSYISIHSFLLD